MKILLTGYKGFIGGCLRRKLTELAHPVVSMDKSFVDTEMDRLEDKVVYSDLIFHVGAISDTSLQDESEMLKYNYLFSKRLFDLAQRHNKKVIYSSSAACLGDGDGVPNNIYGWSKLLAEDYGMAKCDEFVSLRYFNVYGLGETLKGKMASVAYQAWEKGSFKLFPTHPKRDFVYIDDVVYANICAMGAPRGIYEVGCGEARTFESLLEGMGIEYEYHAVNKIPSWYQHYTCANKEKRVPCWEPRLNVERGTKKYKEYLNPASVAQR